MTKLYAVAYVDLFYNELTIEFHQAENWHEALSKFSKLASDENVQGEYMEHLGSLTLEDAQAEAFNGDWMFDVKEVTTV